MAYPRKLLSSGEEIVFETRPHWRALALPILILIATVAATSFLAAKLDDSGAQGTLQTVVYIAAALVFVVWVLRPFLYWLTTEYVFTTRRIIVRSGLVSRHGRDMPISRVNDVSFHKTVWERILNCGTLVVESAGEQGQLVIAQVPNVETIQRDIYRLHEEDDERRRGNMPQAQQPGVPPTPELRPDLPSDGT